MKTHNRPFGFITHRSFAFSYQRNPDEQPRWHGPSTHPGPAARRGRAGRKRAGRLGHSVLPSRAGRRATLAGPPSQPKGGNDRDGDRAPVLLAAAPRSAPLPPGHEGRNLNSRPRESNYGTPGHAARKKRAFPPPAPTPPAPPAKNKHLAGEGLELSPGFT